MSLRFKLIWIVSIIVVSLCCGAPTILVLFHSLGGAYVLSTISPPDYPDSELVDRQKGGGSGGTWTESIYHTSDSVDQVLPFMETHLPGFRQREPEAFRDEIAPVYSNGNCVYETNLGRYFFGRGSYPCISVTIHPDSENPRETLIIIWESYPDS